jgi:hypothetical protein
MSVPEHLPHSAVPSMTGEAALYHIIATDDPCWPHLGGLILGWLSRSFAWYDVRCAAFCAADSRAFYRPGGFGASLNGH